MTSLKYINDPTKAMNAALILFAKAFQQTAPTNNNQKTSSNPRNRQIAQLFMNMGQDRQNQNVGGNGRSQFGQYARQVVQNQQGYNAWQNGGIQGIANHNGTGNVVAIRAEGTGTGNQAMCYNCRGLGIQLQAKKFDFMAAIGDLDKIEEVNANYILMANLQHTSTSGTQLDKVPVYDTDGSAEPIPVPQLVSQNGNHVTSVAPSMVQSEGTVETSSAPNEETRSHQETVYRNLVDQVAQINMINCKYDKISYDKDYNDMQQKVEWLQAQLRDLKGTSVTPHVDKSKLSAVTSHSKKLHASIPSQPREFNVVKHRNRQVIVKENVSSNMVTASSTRLVHTARTRRPQPKSNTRNDRVPFAYKSSKVKKNVTVEDHRRTLLLSKNQKTMSSEFCLNLSVVRRLGCSKHMTGNIKLFINFVWKFFGTIRFENDHIAAILGYGYLKWGNITITRVYFVEGLGHNLFSVSQFCDADLEVAFRRNTCFIRDLDGVDLLNGNRSTNLYTISLCDMVSASPICLMARTTHTKTKDETLEVIKNFLKMIYVHLQAPVIIVPTDNGTKFKNHVLKEYFDSVGIIHETSAAKTPQQNGVVEHRNHTLVKVARTMLIFSHASLFSWAEAIATAPSKRDLDILFEPLHNEYLGGQPSAVPRTIHVAPVIQNLQTPTASMSFQDSTPAPTSSSNTPVSSHNVDVPSQQHAQQQRDLTPSPTASAADNVPNAVFEGDLLVNLFATPSTKFVDHPLEQVIGEPSRPVLTRNQLKTDGDMRIYALTVIILELKFVREALTDLAWIESMQEELHQFIRLDVWELVLSPDGIKPLTLKWLFKNKHDEENTVIGNKTRLDIFLAYAAHKGFIVYQIDVKTTFLHGSLKEDMYVCQPKGFIDADYPSHVYKLKKALYGLKQAPRAWYDEQSTILLQNGFSKGTIDPTLFTRRFDDDILVSNYVNEILKKYGLNTCDIIGTLMDIKDKLNLDQIRTPVNATQYRSMIGALMYLTSSRLDIVHANCVCARYQAHPTKSTLKSQSQWDLPKDTLIDRLKVLRYDTGKRSKVRMGIMPTETELTLEQTQQEHQSDIFYDNHSDDGNPSRANIKQALSAVTWEILYGLNS
nr:hypothetical protein [Tanacetum cinerariifolium]